MLIDRYSMRRGDVVPIPFGSTEYVLVLDRMNNQLVGRDFCVFLLSTTDNWECEKIERLLEYFAASDVVFVRNAEAYSSELAATHLRTKLEMFGTEHITLEQFIDDIASNSTRTGMPYRIRRVDGSVVEAATWLRQKAERLYLLGRVDHVKAETP